MYIMLKTNLIILYLSNITNTSITKDDSVYHFMSWLKMKNFSIINGVKNQQTERHIEHQLKEIYEV